MDGLAETKTPGYSHTQRAPLCLILYGFTIYSIVLGWIIGDTLGMYVAGGVGLLLVSLAPCFHHLNLRDQGEVLGIQFGPIPLFRRTVRYADIKKVEVGRTPDPRRLGHSHEHPRRLGLEPVGPRLCGGPPQEWRFANRHERCHKPGTVPGRENQQAGNPAVKTSLLTDLPLHLPHELVTKLLDVASVRIERIVSLGYASPDGFWYDQHQHEWVVLLKGAAKLRFEDEVVEMKVGDFVNIPAHTKHRVEWTAPDEPTIWLAVHYGEARVPGEDTSGS